MFLLFHGVCDLQTNYIPCMMEHTASPVHILFVVAAHTIIAPGENK
jgi:hypothetical protein